MDVSVSVTTGWPSFRVRARYCPCWGSYAAFDGSRSRYVDALRSWQADEPAIDMSGTAIPAAAAHLAR
jgi:endoglucanase